MDSGSNRFYEFFFSISFVSSFGLNPLMNSGVISMTKSLTKNPSVPGPEYFDARMHECYEGIKAVLPSRKLPARGLNYRVCFGLDISVSFNQYACRWKNVL